VSDETRDLQRQSQPDDTTGTETPASPVVRALSDQEKNILARRQGVVQQQTAELQKAAMVYQETLTLLTGGDESLRVDVQKGLIVRKSWQ